MMFFLFMKFALFFEHVHLFFDRNLNLSRAAFFLSLCFLLLWGGEKRLQLLLVIRVKIVKMWNLRLMSFLLFLSLFCIFADERFNLLLVLFDIEVSVSNPRLQLLNVRLYCILFELGHQCLTHAESNWTLIQCLISLDCHFDFIANTHKQEATLGTVDRDLANQLIEALGE